MISYTFLPYKRRTENSFWLMEIIEESFGDDVHISFMGPPWQTNYQTSLSHNSGDQKVARGGSAPGLTPWLQVAVFTMFFFISCFLRVSVSICPLLEGHSHGGLGSPKGLVHLNYLCKDPIS